MANGEQGFFSQLGLTDKTQEELLAERQAAAQAEQQAALEGLLSTQKGADQATARAGFQVGQALTHFLSPTKGKPTLSKEERLQLGVKEDANLRIQEIRKTKRYQDATPDERAAINLEQIAASAAERGMADVATQAALQAEQTRLNAKKQRTAIEAQEEGTRRVRQQIRLATSEEKRKQAGRTGAFIVPDAGQAFSIANPTVITGQIQPNGMLETADGEQFGNFMTVEDFDTLANVINDATDGEPQAIFDLPLKDRLTQFRNFMGGTTGLRNAREQLQGVRKQAQITDGIIDIFDNIAERGEEPGQVLATSGKLVAFASNIRNTIKSVTSVFGPDVADPEDGEVVRRFNPQADGTETLKNLGLDKSVIQIPDDLQGAEAAQYISATVQMAYALARANEPGARQLSDTDFKNAIITIGANAADPKRLMGVIGQRINEGLSAAGHSFDTTIGIGAEFGLNEDQAASLVYGGQFKDTRKQVGETLERIDRRLSGFGLDRVSPGEVPAEGDPVEQPISPGPDPVEVPEGSNIIRFDANGDPIL